MKKVVIGALAAGTLVTSSFAMDKAVIPLKDLNFKFGVQHRVMYNYSNIASPHSFRQRLRVNFDISTESGVGTYFQLEYRGGWGGSSPDRSDPRDAYAPGNAAFNRLQARGLRWIFICSSGFWNNFSRYSSSK